MPQVGATCYGSDSAALAAIASGEVGKVVPAGQVVYAVSAQPAASAVAIAYTLTPIAGGDAITSTVAVVLQPCQMLDWSDGLELGWGIGGVWILTAIALSIRKAGPG